MSEVSKVSVIKVNRTDKNDPIRESIRALLEQTVHAILISEDAVSVDYSTHERTTVFKVQCPQQDLCRLVGSKGRTISSLRIILAAIAAKKGIRAIIEIPYYPPPANK